MRALQGTYPSYKNAVEIHSFVLHHLALYLTRCCENLSAGFK